jgi:hypothetical protein
LSSSSAAAAVAAEPKASATAAPDKVHWSLAPALSGGSGGDQTFVNLADGAYDEGAAAREFQDAVAAWRTGGDSSSEPKGSNSSEGAGGSGSPTTSLAAYGSTSFSLGAPPGPETDAAYGGGSGGASAVDWWASADGKKDGGGSFEACGGVSGEAKSGTSAPSLMAGEYDEGAAAREFQEAVAAWRTGGPSDNEAKGTSSRARVGAGGTAAGLAVARPSAVEVAAALAKQLDDNGATAARERADARAAAEAELKKRRQEVLERLAKLRDESKGSESDDEGKGDEGDCDGFDRCSDEDDESAQLPTPRQDVAIAEVESTLGYTPRGGGAESPGMAGEEYVVVEEEDD